MRLPTVLALLAISSAASLAAGGEKKPERLYGVRWYESVDRAIEVARSQTTRTRAVPVFWLRMLGDLGGFA